MQTKCCSICGIEKDCNEFYPSKDGKYQRTAYCKECGRKNQKTYYKDNKISILSNQKTQIRQNRTKIRAFIINYLQKHPCIDCGEKDPIVLEFDHNNGRKISAISTLVYQKASMRRIEEEIAKCVVRCANCHRRKTAKERGWYWFPSENAE